MAALTKAEADRRNRLLEFMPVAKRIVAASATRTVEQRKGDVLYAQMLAGPFSHLFHVLKVCAVVGDKGKVSGERHTSRPPSPERPLTSSSSSHLAARDHEASPGCGSYRDRDPDGEHGKGEVGPFLPFIPLSTCPPPSDQTPPYFDPSYFPPVPSRSKTPPSSHSPTPTPLSTPTLPNARCPNLPTSPPRSLRSPKGRSSCTTRPTRPRCRSRWRWIWSWARRGA